MLFFELFPAVLMLVSLGVVAWLIRLMYDESNEEEGSDVAPQ